MASEPRLRAVPHPDQDGAQPAEQDWRPPAPSASSRWMIALAAALAISLGLLAWSRMQLAERIDVLEGEVRALEAAVERRNVVIDAQDDRLDDVRARIGDLRSLLDRPLPSVD